MADDALDATSDADSVVRGRAVAVTLIASTQPTPAHWNWRLLAAV